MNEVDVTERLEIDECYGSRRRQAADGKAALDDTAQTVGERIAFAQLEGGTTQVVRPVVAFQAWHIADVELCALVEL